MFHQAGLLQLRLLGCLSFGQTDLFDSSHVVVVVVVVVVLVVRLVVVILVLQY